MNNKDAKLLLEKYRLGTINQKEKQLLEIWYAKTATENELEIKELELDKNLDETWANISEATKPKEHKKIKFWPRLAAAAVIVLVAGLSTYFYQNEVSKNKPQQNNQQLASIKPGGNRATLTLANGEVITLDDANSGKLAEQNGIVITKTTDGKVIYSSTHHEGEAPKFNTISTPKGGQYQVHLPDGTKVWLNAASSLKYPTFFTGSQRKVSLTGEAYFEVAKSNLLKGKNMPFVVASPNQEVTVLGTHFNVNSYSDEDAVKTTLLEGAVKVTSFKKDNIQS
ncbi:MAG: anti-sigma factor, partial [Pedobacter sp.]